MYRFGPELISIKHVSTGLELHVKAMTIMQYQSYCVNNAHDSNLTVEIKSKDKIHRTNKKSLNTLQEIQNHLPITYGTYGYPSVKQSLLSIIIRYRYALELLLNCILLGAELSIFKAEMIQGRLS